MNRTQEGLLLQVKTHCRRWQVECKEITVAAYTAHTTAAPSGLAAILFQMTQKQHVDYVYVHGN
jgi:hypothetical protein